MNTDREKLRQKIEAGNFIQNNGRVLRAINVLRCKFNKIKDIEYALDISHDEIVDCVNYLDESGFINLRHITTHQDTSLADTSFSEIEAKLSAQGIKLLAGKIIDDCIEL